MPGRGYDGGMYTVRQFYQGEERSASYATAAEAVNGAARWREDGPLAITTPMGIATTLDALRDAVLEGKAV